MVTEITETLLEWFQIEIKKTGFRKKSVLKSVMVFLLSRVYKCSRGVF